MKIRNRHQRAIDLLRAEGYLTPYDIAPHVDLSPGYVAALLGDPCKTVPHHCGAIKLWSHGRVSAVFGWPDA